MVNSKSFSLILGVLIMSFLVGFLVWAWTEPTVSPPSGNVAGPLNTGSTAQSKSGTLTFPAFYDFNNNAYFIDPSAVVSGLFAGNVGIGTTNPGTARLKISGGNLDMDSNRITNLAAPTASTDAARKEDVDAVNVSYKINILDGVPKEYQGTTGTSIWARNDGTNFSQYTTYTKVKEIKLHTVPQSMLKIYFAMRVRYGATCGGYPNDIAYARIYRNGVPVGTERSSTACDWMDIFTEEIAGWSDGDLLQIYAKMGPGTSFSADVNDLRVLGTIKMYGPENTVQ